MPSNKRKRSSSETWGIERRSVTVEVPGTSANMGTGWDTIGIAVDIWNTITISRSDEFEISISGEGEDVIPLDESNLVYVGLKKAFELAKKPVPVVKIECVQRIPHARGLGSSSAAIVGGLLGGLSLAGHQLEVQGKEALLQVATEIEGHPDNVAPAIYGGIQLGIFNKHKGRYETERIPLPNDLVCVAFIPDKTPVEGAKTEALRKVVPKKVDLSVATHQLGHFAWLIHALITGKTENLRAGLEDKIHQTQRGEAVYHHLMPMMEAAYEAGAVGCWLSGAGPTVMTWVTGGSGDFFTQAPYQRKDGAVQRAMQKVANDMGVPGKCYITHSSQTGGVVVKADPPYTNDVVSYNGRT